MNTVLKWGTALVSAGLIMVACRITTDDQGGASSLYSAKFENGEISGWNSVEVEKSPDGFIKFSASDMVTMVNGGAADYISKGMVEGFAQYMAKGDQTYQCWVMDFSSEANAEDMYSSKVQQFASDKEAAASYSQTKAFVRPSQYGYDGYAIFGKYMVVIWLDGFGANKSEAKNKTVEFLQTIELKLNELGLLS